MVQGTAAGVRAVRRRESGTPPGFGLLELMGALAVVGLLLVVALPGYQRYLERSRMATMAADMAEIEAAIEGFQYSYNRLPDSLAQVGKAGLLDPWGNAYRYLNLETAPPGAARKDRFLVPLNTDYDLYSMGKDGRTAPPLTAAQSRDDYIRANNGGFYGWAADY